MLQKDSNKKWLKNILKISTNEYYNNTDILNALESRIVKMVNKIKRFSNRYNILEKKADYFQSKTNLLIKENKALRKENEAIREVIAHSININNHNVDQYENKIRKLRQIIREIVFLFQNNNFIDFETVNKIIVSNGIGLIQVSAPRKHYKSFEEAFEATNNSERIVEIDDNGNAIKEYSLPCTFSFIVNKEDAGECSNSNHRNNGNKGNNSEDSENSDNKVDNSLEESDDDMTFN
ncbi:1633_t:CDS:2, partial [Gigaspora margarita]